jgi:hypothetical protein
MSKQAQMEFLIDFTLEVLRGCKWNCAGCNVDKVGQLDLTDSDHARLLELFRDLQQNHHILSNFGIGPTDFMAAENTLELMPRLVPMMDMFHAVTLQTTFLEKPEAIAKWAKAMRPFLAGREVKFATPLDPKHYKHKKMFDVILSNRDLFVELIPDMKYTKTYLLGNLVEYREYNADPFNNEKITFEEYSDIFRDTSSGNYLDLIISDGRSSLKDINNRERLKSTIKYQTRLYNEGISTDSSKRKINFTYGHRHEGFDKDYVYRNGNIYSPVFVGEPLLMFEPEYSIDQSQQWSTNTLIEFENQMLVDSLMYLEKTNECSTCEFAPLCVGRGVIKLMETLREKQCISPKLAFERTRQQ